MLKTQSVDKYIKILIHPLFLITGLSLIVFSYYFIDQTMTTYYLHIDNESFKKVAQFTTKFGDALYPIAGLLLLSCVFKWIIKNRHATFCSFYLLVVVVATGIACNVFKFAFSRARPVEWFTHDVYGFWFYQFKASFLSFPSGHTTTIISLMAGASLLWPRFTLLFLPFGLVVAFSRVAVTAHYFSDILAGTYLGLLGALVLYKLFVKKFTSHVLMQ